MTGSEAEKRVLQAIWTMVLETIRVRDPEMTALVDAALAHPGPETIAPLLAIGRNRPWAGAVNDVLVQVGTAAAMEILGDDQRDAGESDRGAPVSTRPAHQ